MVSHPASGELAGSSARFVGRGGAPVKRSLQIVKYSVFIPLLSLVLLPQAMESESLNSLPKSEDIFTIAINPIPLGPASTARYFTPESLREALPNFKRGEAEIKPGARRVWESGVIVLNNRGGPFLDHVSEEFHSRPDAERASVFHHWRWQG